MPQTEQPARHTEEPLEVVDDGMTVYVVDETDRYVAEFSYTASDLRAEALANAHLFKAAPQMLAALEALVEEWEPEDSDPFWDEARAAIKAARGG